MCGLFLSNDPLVSHATLQKIENRIAFRGPDAQSGLVEHKNWKAYHARLTIIGDAPEFDQPFFTPEGGLLVFNGEILNFHDLANKYSIEHQGSDTVLLSRLVEHEGFNLGELEGFFAFAYIDGNGNLKYCARDKFGVKPLFVHERGSYISISSEASALSDIFNLEYSVAALEEYRVFRAPIYEESYFAGVTQVHAGTCVVNGTYFDSEDFVCDRFIESDMIDELLRDRVQRGIASRRIADMPIGLLYSGGIDSNIIDASTGYSLTCFTGGFNQDFDIEHAKKLEGDRANIVTVRPDQFRTRLREMVKLRKEPLSVPNEVLLSFLAQAWQKQGGRVLLSGESADEFFAGYDRIFSWALEVESFTPKEFLSRYAYVSVEEISPEIVEKTDNFFSALRDMSSFEKVRQFFVKIHLPLLFRRLDFALMYAGVEGREPLATPELYKLAMQIAPKDFFKFGRGKAPLRELAKSYFGEQFAYMEKVGFPVDLGLMLRDRSVKERRQNYQIWFEENMELLK